MAFLNAIIPIALALLSAMTVAVVVVLLVAALAELWRLGERG
jgi:hypothetical protein